MTKSTAWNTMLHFLQCLKVSIVRPSRKGNFVIYPKVSAAKYAANVVRLSSPGFLKQRMLELGMFDLISGKTR